MGKHVVLKHVLRVALEDALPAEINQRKDKVGFTSNMNELLRGEWSKAIVFAQSLLKDAYPNVNYYFRDPNNMGAYGRWRYQILQLAITHMLFCQKMSVSDVEALITKEISR